MKKDEVRKATDKILNGLEKDFKKAYQKAYFDASIYFKKKALEDKWTPSDEEETVNEEG